MEIRKPDRQTAETIENLTTPPASLSPLTPGSAGGKPKPNPPPPLHSPSALGSAGGSPDEPLGSAGCSADAPPGPDIPHAQETEIRKPDRQTAAKALALIHSRRTLFARQGAIVATWRRSGEKRLGPYYELVWREDGRRRYLYLGREGPAVQQVREALQILQKPLRQARVLYRHNQYVRRLYRIHRKDLDRRLRAIGLRLQGHEVRGWRLARAACGGSIQSLQSSIPARPVPIADFLQETRENWKIVMSSAKPARVEAQSDPQTSAA